MNDDIGKMPDLIGGSGRAWRMDLGAMRTFQNIEAENDGTIVGWVVEAPWAHPLWHSYAIFSTHLRPLPDQRETIFYLPDATHEIWVYALDPEQPRAGLLNERIRGLLQPINFAGQYIAASDAAAIERIDETVALIVTGQLNPDTDAIRQWVALFGDWMLKK